MPTCPNCGGTEVDEYGDCAKCLEPNISGEMQPTGATDLARTELYEKLDHEIRDTLLDFVRCGRALKEMRDSQAYLAKYPTFEGYVKAVEGFKHVRDARRKITNAIIYDSIAGEISPPTAESQVEALGYAAKMVEQVEVRDKPNGGKVTIKQPVAVKNAKQVQRIWSKVQKEYEQQRTKDEKEGKPARKLTSSFIIDRLPDDFKPQHILGRRNSNTCTQLISAIDKLPKLIEARNMLEGERLKTIMEKEGWSDNDKQQLSDAIAESRKILDSIAGLL